jgi:hypothetical protein
MKDCWAMLGISPTRDVEAIKKAYRDLVRQYHPDKARSPERVRHYTIKCAQINEAFERAIEFANAPAPTENYTSYKSNTDSAETTYEPYSVHETVYRESTYSSRGQVHKANPPSRRTAALIAVVGMLLLVAICVLPFVGIFWLPKWLASLPYDDPARMIVCGLLAIPVGLMLGGVISMITTFPFIMVLVMPLWNTRFEKYSFKLLWLLTGIANASIVYLMSGGTHWPFEHRVNTYYTFLYHLCRFAAWAGTPIIGLIVWAKEYIQFHRVRAHADSVAGLPQL